MATQPTLINSVVRALHILDAIGSHEQPQPAKKVARATGIPLPTTYHLLRTLAHEGYVVRTGDGFALGDRVDALAQRSGVRRSRGILQQLHEELRAPAYLAEIDDGEIRLTDIVDSPAAPRTDLWVGLHEAAHATALGKVMLGTLPEPERREYLATHPLVDLTPRTHTSARALLAEVSRAGELAVDRQEYVLGVVCAAVRVPGQPRALGVSVPLRRAKDLLSRVAELRRSARLIALAHA